jgi:hypothetical protein
MRYPMLIFSLSIILISCSKDKEDSFNSDALTTGSWKLSGYMTDYQKDGTYEENTFAILADCEKDNIYTFHTDGSGIVDEGPTKCLDNEPQTQTFSWRLNDGTLTFGSQSYQLEELSESTLRLKARTSYNVIYTIDVKTTYTKQ